MINQDYQKLYVDAISHRRDELSDEAGMDIDPEQQEPPEPVARAEPKGPPQGNWQNGRTKRAKR